MPIGSRVDDAAFRDALLARHMWDALGSLRADTAPRWGRMSPQQMVEHLAWIFEVSTGRASVECVYPEAKRERYKSFLHDDTPMMREFRNPALAAGLPPLQHAGLPEAIAALRREVEHFLDAARVDAPAMHPTFGPLRREEWSRSHFKHVVHHLEQFGLPGDGPATP
jgi:oxepin-CoA hydrolase/3-oxo-5,6-dehydrosuberyl-CoA semialdehyde dehydrogenase